MGRGPPRALVLMRPVFLSVSPKCFFFRWVPVSQGVHVLYGASGNKPLIAMNDGPADDVWISGI